MRTLFEHYASVETQYSKMMAPVCRACHLTYMEFTVLMFLANHPHYDTAAQIVRYRHLTKSHVSVSIHSLEKSGLLRSENDPTDRRVCHLTITPAADPIIEKGHAAQQAFRQRLFAGLSSEELELFHSILQRIDNNLEQAETQSTIF